MLEQREVEVFGPPEEYYVALRTSTKDLGFRVLGWPLGTHNRSIRESPRVKGLRWKLSPKENTLLIEYHPSYIHERQSFPGTLNCTHRSHTNAPPKTITDPPSTLNKNRSQNPARWAWTSTNIRCGLFGLPSAIVNRAIGSVIQTSTLS